MRIKENVTVYICEYCKKKLFKKHAMEYHEKWCDSNPNNHKACSSCIHLKETTIEISVPYPTYEGPETRTVKAFSCEKLNKLLFPTKVQRRNLDKKYPETFGEQEPMPKDCEHQAFYL